MIINPIITMMKECVVKRISQFNLYETADMSKKYDIYRLCYYKLDLIKSHTYVIDDFLIFGILIDDAKRYIDNKNLIELELSSEMCDNILVYMRNKVLSNYVEENTYVRMLMGLPSLDNNPNIKLSDYTNSVETPNINLDINIELLSSVEIKKIYDLGLLQKVIDANPTHTFLTYLYRKNTVIKIRDTEAYGLISCKHYTTTTEYESLFDEVYAKNLIYFKYVLINSFYESRYTNYEIMSMLYLVFSTGTQTAIKASIEITDFDDKGMIVAFLNSNGIDYIDLPATMMAKFIEKLTYLNSIKGTKQCLIDLKSIFDVNSIYRYILKKNVKVDIFDEETPNADKYEIAFVRVPLEEKNLRPYFESEEYIAFDDVVTDDPYWGTSSGNQYEKLLAEDFSYLESKYISIENMMEISKNTYMYSSLYGYILRHPELSDHYQMIHKRGDWFEFSVFDAFIYLTLLIIKMKGYNDIIPDTIDSVSYVMGLDPIKDKVELEWLFKKTYSGENRFIITKMRELSTVDDIYEFMDIFVSTKDGVALLNDIISTTSNFEEYTVAKKVLDSVLIVKTIKDTYKSNDGSKYFTTYEEYIKENNINLYNNIQDLVESNIITDYQDEIVYIIDLIGKKLNDRDDSKISSALGILDDIRDEFGGDINNLLKEVLKYFISMSVMIKDFSLVFKLDDKSERIAILEQYKSKTKSKVAETIHQFDDIVSNHRRDINDIIEVHEGVFCFSEQNGVIKIY